MYIPKRKPGPTKSLDNSIMGKYFSSLESKGSQELLELVNTLWAAQSLREKKAERSRIPNAAAWTALTATISPDKLRLDFSEKSKRAAKLIVENPKLALQSADLFIFLRTAANEYYRTPVVREVALRSTMNSMLREAAVLKYG